MCEYVVRRRSSLYNSPLNFSPLSLSLSLSLSLLTLNYPRIFCDTFTLVRCYIDLYFSLGMMSVNNNSVPEIICCQFRFCLFL